MQNTAETATAAPGPADWLNVEQFAKRLRTSQASVYRRCASGEFPHRKPAGLGIRFHPDDIKKIEDAAYRPATRGVLAGVA